MNQELDEIIEDVGSRCRVIRHAHRKERFVIVKQRSVDDQARMTKLISDEERVL